MSSPQSLSQSYSSPNSILLSTILTSPNPPSSQLDHVAGWPCRLMPSDAHGPHVQPIHAHLRRRQLLAPRHLPFEFLQKLHGNSYGTRRPTNQKNSGETHAQELQRDVLLLHDGDWLWKFEYHELGTRIWAGTTLYYTTLHYTTIVTLT